MKKAVRRRTQMKKRSSYVRYGVFAALILAVCTVFLALWYFRRKKEKPERAPAKRGSAKKRTAGKETGKRKAAGKVTTKEETLAEDSRQEGRGKNALICAGGGLYAALVLGICLAPLVFMWSRPGGGKAENRRMASPPKLWTSEGLNWNYPADAGAYFTDHFAFRQEAVALNSKIRTEVFGVSPVEDVIAGKNGWLYYAATLDDYQHKNGVSERMLFNMAHNIALMQEYSEGLGKTFLFTVAPNKNTLYDENMPDRLRFQVAEKSDAERLKPWLLRENVNYVDLFALFGEQEEVLYYARDSHWNEKGAVLVCNALLDAAGKSYKIDENPKLLQRTDYFGDLSLMLFPVEGKPEDRILYALPDTWYYAEGEKPEDQFIRTMNEEGEGNLLLYRDSFGNSLLPYLAQAFSQAVFSRQVPYPMSDLVTCEPDIVIVEKVERHLPTLGTVPPLMSGPLRTEEKECIPAQDSAATVFLSKEGSYWKFEGTADQAYMDTDSRIYVEVDDGREAKRYEAFCVSRTDAESGSTNDYGYLLYISEIAVEGDEFQIRVMTEREGVMTVLFRGKIQG